MMVVREMEWVVVGVGEMRRDLEMSDVCVYVVGK